MVEGLAGKGLVSLSAAAPAVLSGFTGERGAERYHATVRRVKTMRSSFIPRKTRKEERKP
jgi:hypothetical protein